MGKIKKVKKERKPRIGHVGQAILGSIAVVGFVSVVALFPGMTCAFAPFIKKKTQPRKQRVESSIETLIQSGLVRKSIRPDGEVILLLTEKGKWEALLHSKSMDAHNDKWDRLWRVVIFDVPQSKNKIRNELRHAMRLYGFKILQQSVWVYPYACDDFVEILKKHLGVSQDVLYMKVAFIENDGHLRKEFGIA